MMGGGFGGGTPVGSSGMATTGFGAVRCFLVVRVTAPRLFLLLGADKEMTLWVCSPLSLSSVAVEGRRVGNAPAALRASSRARWRSCDCWAIKWAIWSLTCAMMRSRLDWESKGVRQCGQGWYGLLRVHRMKPHEVQIGVYGEMR